ncbi:MAG: ATP-binding protein [Candidatus Kapaibacterium sp.]
MSVMLIVLLIWIFAVKITSNYIISKASETEEQIIKEKNKEREKYLNVSFKNLSAKLTEASNKISGNLDVRKDIERSDMKKLHEVVYSASAGDSYDIEIFDKRIEQVLYKGKQLYPEIILIQKALNGKSTMLIKEIGFFTYLIKYTPILRLDNETNVQGVLVCGILVDSKYSPSQYEFNGRLFTEEISKDLTDPVKIQSAGIQDAYKKKDTLTALYGKLELRGDEGNIIGLLSYPKYNFSEHKNNIEELSGTLLSVLGFLFTILLIPILLKFVNLFKSIWIRLFLFLITLLLVRFFWILSGFPSAFMDFELFNPQFFASKLGGGIFQSLGDVLITILFVVVYSSFLIKNVFTHFAESRKEKSGFRIFHIVLFVFVIAVYFGLFNVYGSVIQSLIFDSNIKLLDKSNIIPDTPLFVIQLSILLITFAYILINVSLVIALISSSRSVSQFKIYRKSFIFILFLLFLAINELFNVIQVDFYIIDIYRIIITFLVFLISTYFFRQISSKRSIPLFTVKNLSLILLGCIIITPVLILEFTKSQETYFVEKIGAELTENQSDKIIFLLSDELSKLKEDIYLDEYISDENKAVKLPYFIWSKGKFNYEKYKSDIILTDTSKRIISDFNNSNNLINSDSVITFLKKNYFERNIINEIDESDTLQEETDFETDPDFDLTESPEPIFFDDIIIIENTNEKYFAGILPIENEDLRNTQYAELKGYIIAVLNSETINLFTENQFTGNSNINSGNISDRLISKPVITEILNDEIINTTEAEVSKSLLKFKGLFNESIKSTEKNTSWRYDPLVNERYRSYYIKINSPVNSSDERIFVISIKRDDFSLLMFYFLKFVLFALTIFVVFNIVYSSRYLINIRLLKVDFRSKLFLTFIFVSVIPIVILAIYTRSYISSKNDVSYRNQLLSDLGLLNETLKDEKVLFNRYKPTDTIMFAGKEILTKSYGNVDKNFNIFVKSKLIATTNEELYKSDFLDTRVPEEGYFNILILKRDLFLESKEIQGQNYLVGYKPLKDRNNNVNGIISSLSVYRQKEIQEELTETLTFIFGSYFIVIIILFVIVGFITAKLSKPISVLQEATEKIAKGEEDVLIDIDRSDEFGSLVDSFNKMTHDLKKSREALKKAEREAAWRDIARRVAHEIKNPLTPMKLSIEHLYNLYQEKEFEQFEETLTKTKLLITKEVEKLANIATAFSDYAKLPRRNYEPLNINEVLEDVISLYSLSKDLTIEKELSKDLSIVNADRQEMNRAFQNLIKNAVQSFEEMDSSMGNRVICVRSYNKPQKVVVEIIDNGVGMDEKLLEKLFEPNFSTKKTGMGLGLSITKKSLDDMKADINYTSIKGEGTTVRVEFEALK